VPRTPCIYVQCAARLHMLSYARLRGPQQILAVAAHLQSTLAFPALRESCTVYCEGGCVNYCVRQQHWFFEQQPLSRDLTN
jgi:hypothetical protein